MNFNKTNLDFILLILLPLLLITLSANFNFIDSSNYFFKTLFSGKFFYMYSADWPYYNPIVHENKFQPLLAEAALIFFISIYIFFLKKIFSKVSSTNIIFLIILIPIIILSKISSIILLVSIYFFLILFSLKSRNKFYFLFFVNE